MKTIIHISISIALLFIISCETDITKSKESNDYELILAIISAEKISISMDELPAESQAVVDQDFYDYTSTDASVASDLGYEVELAGLGHRTGSRNEVYFNMKGRKLDPYDDGRKDEFYWDRDEKEDWKCFDLVLPVTFIMPDGSTITVSSDDENSWAELKNWYEDNPDSEEKPSLQYPVDITFDGEIVSINNDDEMRELYRQCDRGRDWNREKCFGMLFPVTFTMPDGSSITVETDDGEGWAELKDWYEDNPDSEERPTLQYPVDIVYRTDDGDSVVTINNESEMIAAKEDCREDWEEDDERPGPVFFDASGRLTMDSYAIRDNSSKIDIR